MTKYYILIDKKTAGPYTLEQVKALYESGTVEASFLYSTPESHDWLPLSMLVPLFSIKESNPTPPIPTAGYQQPTIVINNSNNNNSNNTVDAVQVVGSSQKSRGVYQLLAFFLGAFGVHNFYAGHSTRGVVQLLITVCTCGYAGFISWIWAIVDMCTVTVDGNNIPMR